MLDNIIRKWGDWGLMLNNITQSDNYNIKNNDISKVSLNGAGKDKQTQKEDLLVDETNISNDAMALYERDQDIQKFTALALSDMDLVNEDSQRVLDKVFNISATMRDEEFAESLLQNDKFRSDLLG